MVPVMGKENAPRFSVPQGGGAANRFFAQRVRLSVPAAVQEDLAVHAHDPDVGFLGDQEGL